MKNGASNEPVNPNDEPIEDYPDEPDFEEEEF